jgi:hypothetical protein
VRLAATSCLLQCMSPLLALSGHRISSVLRSAIGGKADMDFAAGYVR